MRRMSTMVTLALALILAGSLLAQTAPVPIVESVFIDSTFEYGTYRGHQTQLFFEPTTKNLVTAWYRYTSDPTTRIITAATSVDMGATWTVHEEINLGVGAEFNARYATVWGTAASPLIVYNDQNSDTNIDYTPIFAQDILGWGGGLFENMAIDNQASDDTTLYSRYPSMAVASDDPNVMAVGAYHSSNPGQSYFFYASTDGGVSWRRPTVPMSEIDADSGQTNWVYDLTSRGLGVGLGANHTVMVSGAARIDSAGSLWRVCYATSSDLGATWDPVAGIPGTESLLVRDSETYNNYTSPIVDKDGNWHIFIVGVDTTEAGDWNELPRPYHSYDCRYDGTSWTITKIAYDPAFIPDGVVGWGRALNSSQSKHYPMNEVSIAEDGTIYYTYSDVVDTTGSGGSPGDFNFNMFVIYSEDNGLTWNGPVSVLDNWDGRAPNGAAPYADDKLHLVYTDRDPEEGIYYMGVPTATIKELASSPVNPVSTIMPDAFKLNPCYPNPFNPSTNISFNLKERSQVTLVVYNQLGQQVATLLDKTMEAGFQGITWHAGDMPSGVYFCKLTAGDYTEVQRMVLTK